MRSTVKPMASSRSIIIAWQPPSVGLTDWRAINCSVNRSVSDFGGGFGIRIAIPGVGA